MDPLDVYEFAMMMPKEWTKLYLKMSMGLVKAVVIEVIELIPNRVQDVVFGAVDVYHERPLTHVSPRDREAFQS